MTYARDLCAQKLSEPVLNSLHTCAEKLIVCVSVLRMQRFECLELNFVERMEIWVM